MHKAFTLLLLVAQVLAVGAARGADSPLAASAATLGRATTSGAVIYAPSKTSRTTAAPMVALRVSRASRTVRRAAAPARPHDAQSRGAGVSGRIQSASPPPLLVLRI
jgi:hypothetical protein